MGPQRTQLYWPIRSVVPSAVLALIVLLLWMYFSQLVFNQAVCQGVNRSDLEQVGRRGSG